MADANIAHGGMLNKGTSQGRPPVVASVVAAGIAGRGMVGKKRTGTIDMIKIARGAPKSASRPPTGRSSNRDARNCSPWQNPIGLVPMLDQHFGECTVSIPDIKGLFTLWTMKLSHMAFFYGHTSWSNFVTKTFSKEQGTTSWYMI